MDGSTVHLSNNPQSLFKGSRCVTTKQIVINICMHNGTCNIKQ